MKAALFVDGLIKMLLSSMKIVCSVDEPSQNLCLSMKIALFVDGPFKNRLSSMEIVCSVDGCGMPVPIYGVASFVDNRW